MKILFCLIAGLCASFSMFAQISSGRLSGQDINAISTSVPFLTISPDSRSSAMGDVGVALSPDANASHWNPSKLVFCEDEMGFSLSYSPWLRNLVKDISLSYLSGYKKLSSRSAIGGSLRYFSLGNITFTDITGSVIRDFKPNELALDGTYALKVSDNMSVGITGRYIYSNLAGGTNTPGGTATAGQSFAVDVSSYYRTKTFNISGKKSFLAFGMNMSNIGAKISYNGGRTSDFLPTNLKIGSALNTEIDEYNQFTVALDFNKLLVPTTPVYERRNGTVVVENGKQKIFSGRDPNRGVASALFTSFFDAPGKVTEDENGNTTGVEKGSKLREELSEINIAFGMEYLYNKIFALRGGYFYESPKKGNRNYLTLGGGISYQSLQVDFSYLVSLTQNSPLQNTIRISLNFKIK